MADLLPPIEELTQDQVNKLVCADYIRTLADMIEKGALSAFDLQWSAKLSNKPVGRLVTDAAFIICDAEQELTEKIEKYKAEQAKKISVQDMTEVLKDN